MAVAVAMQLGDFRRMWLSESCSVVGVVAAAL